MATRNLASTTTSTANSTSDTPNSALASPKDARPATKPARSATRPKPKRKSSDRRERTNATDREIDRDEAREATRRETGTEIETEIGGDRAVESEENRRRATALRDLAAPVREDRRVRRARRRDREAETATATETAIAIAEIATGGGVAAGSGREAVDRAVAAANATAGLVAAIVSERGVVVATRSQRDVRGVRMREMEKVKRKIRKKTTTNHPANISKLPTQPTTKQPLEIATVDDFRGIPNNGAAIE